MQCEGPSICRRIPPLRQPWLEVEGRSVDPNQPPLGEEAQKLRRLLARDDPVEGSRHGANRSHKLPTTLRGRRDDDIRGLRRSAFAKAPADRRGRTPEAKASQKYGGRNNAAEEPCFHRINFCHPGPRSWPRGPVTSRIAPRGAYLRAKAGRTCNSLEACLLSKRTCKSIRWLCPRIGANPNAAHIGAQLVIAQRIGSAPPEHIFTGTPPAISPALEEPRTCL